MQDPAAHPEPRGARPARRHETSRSVTTGAPDRAPAADRALSARVVGFCRHLREAGIALGMGEQADAARAAVVTLHHRERFRMALRAATAKNRDEQEIFDACYPAYWDDLAEADLGEPDPAESVLPPLRIPQRGKQSVQYEGDTSLAGDRELSAAAYSPQQVPARTDFALLSAEETEQMSHLLLAIGRQLARSLSRRFQPGTRGVRLDLRRTLRAGLRSGELLDLAMQRRRRRRLKLALICDVSKSMDLYSRFLIQFMFAFQRAYRRIETFVFSTGLHRITDQLRGPNLAATLDQLAATVPEWAGGTRIGASLEQYLNRYGRTALDRRTVVAILSDGWDTGDIDLLGGCMEEIQRRAALVIWLNPLLGNADYRPQTRGMRAALPFVDVFAAAHNAASLRRLATTLAGQHTW